MHHHDAEAEGIPPFPKKVVLAIVLITTPISKI